MHTTSQAQIDKYSPPGSQALSCWQVILNATQVPTTNSPAEYATAPAEKTRRAYNATNATLGHTRSASAWETRFLKPWPTHPFPGSAASAACPPFVRVSLTPSSSHLWTPQILSTPYQRLYSTPPPTPIIHPAHQNSPPQQRIEHYQHRRQTVPLST